MHTRAPSCVQRSAVSIWTPPAKQGGHGEAGETPLRPGATATSGGEL